MSIELKTERDEAKASQSLKRALVKLPWKMPLCETVEWHGGEVLCVKRSRSRRVLRLKAELLGLPDMDPEIVVYAKRYSNVYWWRRVAWLLYRNVLKTTVLRLWTPAF